jgi:hypothetical protein
MLEFGHVSKYDRMYPRKRPTDVQHIHQFLHKHELEFALEVHEHDPRTKEVISDA